MATERKALPAVDTMRCTGCGWCVAVCPPHVMSLAVQRGKKYSLVRDEPGCTGCAKCAVTCPFDAIAMVRLTEPRETR
jgi:ferredoxin